MKEFAPNIWLGNISEINDIVLPDAVGFYVERDINDNVVEIFFVKEGERCFCFDYDDVMKMLNEVGEDIINAFTYEMFFLGKYNGKAVLLISKGIGDEVLVTTPLDGCSICGSGDGNDDIGIPGITEDMFFNEFEKLAKKMAEYQKKNEHSRQEKATVKVTTMRAFLEQMKKGREYEGL